MKKSMLMKKVFISMCLCMLFLSMLIFVSPVEAEQYVMKFGHVSAPSVEADDHLMGLFFKSYIENRSQGRVKVDIYPSGQLGNFRAMLEQVQNGTLECTSTTVGGIASFMPEIQVTDLPYTIRDDAVAAKLQESAFFDEMRKAVLEKTGNILLVAVGNTGSWRNFATTKKSVSKVADLKGLKIRTISSDLQGQFVKLLGASPTPIPWNELYTSLSTGVVDGTKNSIGDYIPMGMAEPLNHICLDGHTYIFGFTWMSNRWLKSLPDDLRGLVLDAMRIGAQIQTNFNVQYQAIASEKWLKMGNTITVPAAQDMKEFLAVRKKMEDWYRSKFGGEWLDRWLAAVEQAERQVDIEREKVMMK